MYAFWFMFDVLIVKSITILVSNAIFKTLFFFCFHFTDSFPVRPSALETPPIQITIIIITLLTLTMCSRRRPELTVSWCFFLFVNLVLSFGMLFIIIFCFGIC